MFVVKWCLLPIIVIMALSALTYVCRDYLFHRVEIVHYLVMSERKWKTESCVGIRVFRLFAE